MYGPLAETLTDFVKLFKLKDILKIAGIPQEVVETLDAALKQIPNQK